MKTVKKPNEEDKYYKVNIITYNGFCDFENGHGEHSYDITLNKSLGHTGRFKGIRDGLCINMLSHSFKECNANGYTYTVTFIDESFDIVEAYDKIESGLNTYIKSELKDEFKESFGNAVSEVANIFKSFIKYIKY